MASPALLYTLLFFSSSIFYFPCLITAQQPYSPSNCRRNTSSALGYTCNGVNKTCESFLIYRAQPPYNTVFSIASLLSANASQISATNNNISVNFTLATNTKVIVPVTCSCAGLYYQANTTHIVKSYENYYVIANNTFEGLTTCRAIRDEKLSPNVVNIYAHEKLTIPLRCACPTKKQVSQGIKYLLSFVVQSGNVIGTIATSLGADVGQTLDANEKSEQDSVVYPFTTLLVPLQNPPNGSQMEYPPYVLPSNSSPPALPPTVTPLSLPSRRSSSKKWVYYGIGVVSGGAFMTVVGIILFVIMGLRKRGDPIVPSQRFEAQEKAPIEMNHDRETESLVFLESITKIASLKVYSFCDLQGATENFSSNHWIKGSVYKGILDCDEVIIKKMDGDVSKEISVLNKINHFNLIRLLGVCFNDGVWYFVYEYAGNGPLSDWIYQDNPVGKTLSWGRRMQVAFDIATGLNYLHSYTSPPHVHKDVRSSNVYLNNEFRAKIAKFGLSRPVRGNDGQFTLTEHIVGTKGYLGPEYLENGVVSPMLDVYAFGVLLLEILTGKDVGRLYEGVKVYLSEILDPLLHEDGVLKLREFIDCSLGDDYPVDIAYTLLVLVDRCLRKDPGSRPTMDEVVQILSKTLTTSLTWGSSSSANTSSS